MKIRAVKDYTLKLYEVTVKDDFGVKIGQFFYRGDTKLSGATKPLKLEAGTYTICVSRVEDESKLELGLHKYALRISVE